MPVGGVEPADRAWIDRGDDQISTLGIGGDDRALISLNVWDEVADRLIRAENVRSALAFIARGEAPLGIVYETDAKVDKKVRVVDVFPADSHLPIRYPVAATIDAQPAAAGFVAYLRGDTAVAAFRKYGFASLP